MVINKCGAASVGRDGDGTCSQQNEKCERDTNISREKHLHPAFTSPFQHIGHTERLFYSRCWSRTGPAPLVSRMYFQNETQDTEPTSCQRKVSARSASAFEMTTTMGVAMGVTTGVAMGWGRWAGNDGATTTTGGGGWSPCCTLAAQLPRCNQCNDTVGAYLRTARASEHCST